MKQNAVKFYAVSLLLIELTGCGGGSKTSSAPTTTPVAAPAIAASGVVQGPMVKGTVNVNILSQTSGTASAIPSISIGTLGAFSTTIPASSVAALTSVGTYYDEVAGATSTANITLSSYASSADTTFNINLLTTLASQRIQSLVTSSSPTDFSTARQKAEKEVLATFYIRDNNTYPFGSLDLTKGRDEDHILAAITSIFENNGVSNVSGIISNLINSFQTEIANNNGIVISTATLNALQNNAIGINPAAIATNLSGKPVITPYLPKNISDWLDQDGDHLIGKFKYSAVQVPVPGGSPDLYTFPGYTVGASDNGATYSFPSSTSYINNPNKINPNFNSTCQFTISGVVSPTVSTGDRVTVSCTPEPHEASSTYLQSKVGVYSQLYVARYDFNPFSTVGNLTVARENPTATVIHPLAGSLNGQVLVAGGTTVVAGVPTATATAELYNPATQTFTTIKNMFVARVGHTATLLKNGSVLVVGGDAQGKAGTAELYNPTSGWTKTTHPPNSGHIYHTATLLQSGEVLVVGGILNVPGVNSVELYDPITGTWTQPFPIPSRYYHTATLLNTGNVLISGGFDGTAAVSDSEILIPTATPITSCTPKSSCWATPLKLNFPRYLHSATLLPDGSVLIAGGFDGTNTLKRSELLDASTNTWKDGSDLNTARVGHVAQLLSDGNVLIAGGSESLSNGTLSSAELYTSGNSGTYPNRFSSKTFNPNGNLAYSRFQFSSVLLNTNDVLLVGGKGVYPAETFK